MCAVKQSQVTQIMRVRRGLERELPSCAFDDVVVEYLAQSLEGDGQVPQKVLIDQWAPYLAAAGAGQDGCDLHGVCQNVLTSIQLQQEQEEHLTPALLAWLDKLCLSQYARKALAWCGDHGVSDLQELLKRWEVFVDDLAFKGLERKRVQRYVASNGERFVPEIPDVPQVVIAAASTKPRKPGTIGPDEEPERYQVLEEIGEGATAKVHRCARGDKIFAVKTIGLSKLRLQKDYNRQSEKLQREVSIMLKLKHKRIVALYDVIEEPDRALHLVMELVRGGDLYNKIVQHGSFAEGCDNLKPDARYAFAQIADALRYIHTQDIVHRDLKPENILVDERSSRRNLLELKLSDFGHSKLINDGYSLALSAGVGTPQYWAPEVSDPKKAALGYDQQVDLWSLGVVLYVMLVGSYPFSMTRALEAQARQAQYGFRTREGHVISSEAQDLIKALIKLEPAERLPLSGCLSHAWVDSGGGEGKPSTMSHDMDANHPELRIPLPVQPTKKSVRMLRSALVEWEKKFHCSATVKHRDVVVLFADLEEHKRAHAKSELLALVERHFPMATLAMDDVAGDR